MFDAINGFVLKRKGEKLTGRYPKISVYFSKRFAENLCNGISILHPFPITVVSRKQYTKMQSELTRLREFEARAKLLEVSQKQARDRD